ncbi:cytochrome c biogenesis heme-transporting ATPase CcmA [Uliginosibacterium sp. H3]|uniref:Cytochrome c biogenesis heme-transporting ATPase CcmA n=1 Tax=Uliginosibacterium silvisoli TaxID=3114758 RepID=A0ABU6K6N8_9RHOO|nr:cytochrome c biogenesis heme-transporting ATPase CcmA [Uliginosibacterium sp. H3]
MLEVKDLACLRGDRLLFRRFDLALGKGEVLRVLGANGVGKTSLLRLLCGLATPEVGEIRWQGEAIQREREAFHAALLYLGHAPALNDLLSPLENLRFACAAAGDTSSETDCRAALTRIGLARQLDLPAKVLSQGQRRRVSLARLFLAAHRPLWILDEPFTALDVAAVAELAEVISQHSRAGGAVAFTSHQDAGFSVPLRTLDISGYAA